MNRTPIDPVEARKHPPLMMVNVRMTREQYDAMTAEAGRRGVTFSALVRGILSDFLRASRG